MLHTHGKLFYRFVNVHTLGIPAHIAWSLDVLSSGGSLLFIPVDTAHTLRGVRQYTALLRLANPSLCLKTGNLLV